MWTNIPPELDHNFNECYNREHMPERILGLDGFVRGRRFVAFEGGPRYLALYDTRSVAAFHTEPYLALKRNYDPVSMRFVPNFKDTRKCAAEVTAQSGTAEGGFISATPIARAPGKAEGLRAWIATSLLPEVVTLPGVDFYLWQAMLAPAGLSRATVAQLNGELNKALGDAEVKTRMTQQGNDLMGGTQQQATAFISAEIARWRKIIKPEMRITR